MTNGEPAMVIATSIETITPEQAAEWLKDNRHNRGVNKGRVSQYAAAMRRGEWMLNGDAIRFDGPDGLLDGQHRLIACVQSDTAIQSVVVRGLPTSAQETMDRGKGRNIGDILKLRGETNYIVLAGALQWLHKFQTGSVRSNAAPITAQQSIALLEAHPGVREMGALVEPIRKSRLMSPSLGWALAYEFVQLDFEQALEFFSRLGSGAELTETNPVFRLRAYLISELGKAKGRSPQWYIAALTIKSWNAWREGRPVHALRFRISEPAAETFPEPV